MSKKSILGTGSFLPPCSFQKIDLKSSGTAEGTPVPTEPIWLAPLLGFIIVSTEE